MDDYTAVSYEASRRLTIRYSTSFSKSITLFGAALRPHIYAIYGLVRIADEIVDTYTGKDKLQLLDNLETETYAAIKRGYSANPIVHAFACTAKQFGIGRSLVHPFFVSMRMDIEPVVYTQALYEKYIDGSAEVVGLMCLRVFLNGDDVQYARLEKGARALGAAYQKVNFLRDIAADYKVLDRLYFPGLTFEGFDDDAKQRIVKDIQKDVATARKALVKLPDTSQRAVSLSLSYYGALLAKLEKTSAATLKQRRVRINNAHKAILLAKTRLRRKASRG